MKLPVPKELQEQLDHTTDAMDELNEKLSTVIDYLGAIHELLKESLA